MSRTSRAGANWDGTVVIFRDKHNRPRANFAGAALKEKKWDGKMAIAMKLIIQ